MIAGFVSPIRRTIAHRPTPAQSASAKTISALREATGPGFALSGASERVLQIASKR